MYNLLAEEKEGESASSSSSSSSFSDENVMYTVDDLMAEGQGSNAPHLLLLVHRGLQGGESLGGQDDGDINLLLSSL